jgi:hypothetical protein
MLDRVLFFCLGVATTILVRRAWNWLSTGGIGV